MILKKVTVTGVDDHTSIPDILRLVALCPKIEVGILVHAPWRRGGRWPSFEWLERIARYIDVSDRGNFSVHLYGDYVEDFFKRDSFRGAVAPFTTVCGRMQINTHDVPVGDIDLGLVMRNVEALNFWGIKPILQYDSANRATHDAIIQRAKMENLEVHALYDMSHGAGILPSKWTGPLEVFTGYAGGLSADNVAAQVKEISKNVAAYDSVWIDAETRLRSADDVFNIQLAERFYVNAMYGARQARKVHVDYNEVKEAEVCA